MHFSVPNFISISKNSVIDMLVGFWLECQLRELSMLLISLKLFNPLSVSVSVTWVKQDADNINILICKQFLSSLISNLFCLVSNLYFFVFINVNTQIKLRGKNT